MLGPKIWTQCASEHSACLYSARFSLRNAPAGSQQVFLFNVANLQLDVSVRYISCQLLLLTCDIRLFCKRCLAKPLGTVAKKDGCFRKVSPPATKKIVHHFDWIGKVSKQNFIYVTSTGLCCVEWTKLLNGTNKHWYSNGLVHKMSRLNKSFMLKFTALLEMH